MTTPAHLYLDLLKRILTNVIYEDPAVVRSGPMQPIVGLDKFHQDRRAQGADWPAVAHTMVGLARLDNLQECVERVIAEGIPGDVIETGVWRGGAAILMRGVLKAHGVTDRTVWVADSFAGLPPPNAEKYPHDSNLNFNQYAFLAVSLDQVRENFRKYNLLDDQVRFLKGWFSDTLPSAEIEKLAVLRIDGDLYESTTDALANLYPKLSEGGYVIIDDFNDIPACKQAVLDYRAAHSISGEIIPVDWTGVCWRK